MTNFIKILEQSVFLNLIERKEKHNKTKENRDIINQLPNAFNQDVKLKSNNNKKEMLMKNGLL
jgi:hypothetical protein